MVPRRGRKVGWVVISVTEENYGPGSTESVLGRSFGEWKGVVTGGHTFAFGCVCTGRGSASRTYTVTASRWDVTVSGGVSLSTGA